ncbi:PilZ domain-containing protein [Sphingomonas sp. LHG3406-1]|uniref:PilZ domain-containing protein n=1 Tax=Sphingomonas sp. LHG3406-1 TaxID=2804617 RepID=UPI002632F6A4|nr:PilZ domain-containing protein [Sphingomonas sp. LHG3406-1]
MSAQPFLDPPSATPIYPPREERRPTALSGWLARPTAERSWDFILTNLSYGGCRLRTDAPLVRGDEVNLTVHRRGAIPAVVRWRNGHGVGLSFVVEAPPRTEVPRQAKRRPLAMAVIVRRAGRRSQSLDASDISPRGCCLAFVDPPRPDDWIWVALPGLEPMEGRIRWVEDYRAGVEFVKPIHDAVFDLLLLRWNIEN